MQHCPGVSFPASYQFPSNRRAVATEISIGTVSRSSGVDPSTIWQEYAVIGIVYIYSITRKSILCLLGKSIPRSYNVMRGIAQIWTLAAHTEFGLVTPVSSFDYDLHVDTPYRHLMPMQRNLNTIRRLQLTLIGNARLLARRLGRKRSRETILTDAAVWPIL